VADWPFTHTRNNSQRLGAWIWRVFKIPRRQFKRRSGLPQAIIPTKWGFGTLHVWHEAVRVVVCDVRCHSMAVACAISDRRLGLYQVRIAKSLVWDAAIGTMVHTAVIVRLAQVLVRCRIQSCPRAI